MAADGKWISDLGPNLSVAEAARRVLEVRLEIVRNYLPLAAHDADRDVEYVHRLRVGTRRSGAALSIFADVLPIKTYQKARKVLRQIRRAAGEARDWDVFIIELIARRKQAAAKDQPGVDFLLGYASGQRAAAQGPLLEADTILGPDLKQRVEDTLASIRDPGGPNGPQTLQELGRVLLLDLFKELDWAASRHLDDYEHLHQVRILGKKVRYAMELFADCFPADFRDKFYPKIEEMQEILGGANDSHVGGLRLIALRDHLKRLWPADWKRYQSGLEGLLRFHQRRLPRERQRFLKWWSQWQEKDSEQLRALLRPAESSNAETSTGQPPPPETAR